MASKTISIPRYLLPQYGALWRTAARSSAIVRPLNAELGQVPVRYASRTSASKSAPARTTQTVAAKVAGHRSASNKAARAAKAAKNSAPTKPPAKVKAALNKGATSKLVTLPSTTKPATSKPATSKPVTPATTTQPVPSTPVSNSVLKTEAVPETPVPAAKSTTAPVSKQVDPSKPLVLEKPEKFNPPSHGARLPRSTPKHYGGAMSDAELQAQIEKTYPGLPPPENTWTHSFLNSRGTHLFITLGTLTLLAIYTFSANFQENSPFADMLPPISQLFLHPFQYIGIVLNIIRLHEERESAITADKRRRKVEDVTKRNEYRKAHGLGPAQGFWAKGLSNSNKAEESQTADEPIPTTAAEPVPTAVESEEARAAAMVTAEYTPDGKRKKFLGIF
ncbi:hypothetical protein GGR54DRAFT_14706 [Hypoxylon sp. NC1633]|nr:hypothetical protein GGR54DRAFT_14706 [Hypoxylon sp. NC1633]